MVKYFRHLCYFQWNSEPEPFQFRVDAHLSETARSLIVPQFDCSSLIEDCHFGLLVLKAY